MGSDHPADTVAVSRGLQLAIETTGTAGSVAVLQEDKVLKQKKLVLGERTAATLAPALKGLLDWVSSQNQKLSFVSVAAGPGSFTGLRIGVTTAKTLCYAKNLPLIGVDSMAAIAATTFYQSGELDRLTVGINAYRGQVFTGSFCLGQAVPGSSDVFSDQQPSKIVDAEQWSKILAGLPPDQKVTGDKKVFKNEHDFLIRDHVDAVGVGLVAWRHAQNAKFTDPLHLVPTYLKQSAAEENIASKG